MENTTGYEGNRNVLDEFLEKTLQTQFFTFFSKWQREKSKNIIICDYCVYHLTSSSAMAAASLSPLQDKGLPQPSPLISISCQSIPGYTSITSYLSIYLNFMF